MSDTIARLQIEFDATQVGAGNEVLLRVPAAAAQAEQAVDRFGQGALKTAASVAELGRAAGDTAAVQAQVAAAVGQTTQATQQSAAAIQRATAAIQQAGQAQAAAGQGAQQAVAGNNAVATSADRAAAAAERMSHSFSFVAAPAGLEALGQQLERDAQHATQMGAAVSQMGAAFDRVAKGELAGLIRASEEINRKYEAGYALAQRRAQVEAGVAAGLVRSETAAKALADAERELGQGGTAGGSGGLGGSKGLANFQLTNASEQLRQFVEQISFGTPVIQAFAQQAPQALVGFGPWAAVLGVAAAAIGGLLTLLPGLAQGHEEAAKGAKDQAKATEDLLTALNVSMDGVEGLRTGLAGLSAQQRSLVGADLTAGLHAQSAAFEEAQKKAQDFITALSGSARSSVTFSSILGKGEFSGPSEEDAQRFAAVATAAGDLQNKFQALQAGVGTFDDVAAAIQRMGDAQREGGEATAKQRVEIEGQIDKLAGLASSAAAAEQAQHLQTAQVHEFLEAMGQKGAITAFDEQILNQAEVAKIATAELEKLNTAHRAVIASQVADRIRESDLPDAGKKAADFQTRELAKGPAQDFQLGQETQRAEATIVFKGDTSQAQKALDLLKEAGTNVGESFERTEQRLKELGGQLGTPFPVVQAAIEKARVEADKLIASQHQAAVTQALIQAGFAPEKAQQQASAIASGTKGLEQRAQIVASIGEAERARDALAAKGPQFARETAQANQQVLQLQGQLHEVDKRRADTARSQAEALRAQGTALLAQQSPEAALIAAEQKIAELRSKGALRSGAEVTQASTGAFQKYADAVASQASQGAQGQGQRVQLQAQIVALQEAENLRGEARVQLEEKLKVAKSALLALDQHDADAIEKQVQAADKALQRSRVQLAQAQRGGSGGLDERVAAAGQQAADSIPGLSDEQARAPNAAGAAVQIAAMREEAQANAEATEKLHVYREAIQALADPMQALAEEQGKLNDFLKAGVITSDQYEAALRRRTVAATQAARQQREQDLLNTGEEGSGVGLGGQAAAGDQASGLHFVDQYGNAAKATAGALTEMGQVGVDSLLQLSQGAEVSAGAIVKSLGLIVEKTLLTIAVAKLLQGILGGPAPAANTASIQQPGGGFVGGGDIMAAYGHTGGDVATLGNRRAVDPMLFAGAPRYHGGGMILGPGEKPIIAKEGEEILTPEQRRSGGSAPVVNVNVTNNAGAAVSAGRARQEADGSVSLDVLVERHVNDLAARGRLDKGMRGRYGVDKQLQG